MADLKSALKVLNRVAKEMLPQGREAPGLADRIAAERKAFAARNVGMQTSDAFPMMPERILADLRAAMPRDVILTSDAGWNKNGVAQRFDILRPGSILIPGGFATMGFAPPPRRGPRSPRRAGWSSAWWAMAALDRIPRCWQRRRKRGWASSGAS